MKLSNQNICNLRGFQMKIEIVNMFTCLHETGTKITKFSIYSACHAGRARILSRQLP